MKKYFLFFVCICMAGFVSGQPSLKKLHEIQKAEDELAAIKKEKEEKEKEKAALQEDYDSKVQTFSNYHASHGSKGTEAQIAACDGYAVTADAAAQKLEAKKNEISGLANRQKEKEDFIYIAKEAFAKELPIPCASGLSGWSTYEQIADCWKCFFDGNCNDYPQINPVPVPGGIKIYPNGAPTAFNNIRNDQLSRISSGINTINVPKPDPPAPQKGFIEQATEKVRGYFREIIKSTERLKVRTTTAVLAVRG